MAGRGKSRVWRRVKRAASPKRIAKKTWRKVTRKPVRRLRERFGSSEMSPAQRKAAYSRMRKQQKAQAARERRAAAAAKKKAAAAAAVERRWAKRAQAAERARRARQRARGIRTGRVNITVGGERIVGARITSAKKSAKNTPPRPAGGGVARVGRAQGVGGRGARRPASMQAAKRDPRWTFAPIDKRRRKWIRMLPESRLNAIPHFGKRRHDPIGVRNCPQCRGYGLVDANGAPSKKGQSECPACQQRRAFREQSYRIAAQMNLPKRRMRL